MKITGHLYHLGYNHIMILFDQLDIAHSESDPSVELSDDSKFREIGKKYGLTYDVVRGIQNQLLIMFFYLQDGMEVAYSFDCCDNDVTVHKAYTKAAEEAFNLATGESLKLLWKDYCISIGIPVPA